MFPLRESVRSDRREIEVSVVLPCLDEAETLGTCVLKAIAALRDAGVRGEVIVADNGSSDGSQEIARQAGARVIHVPVRGYGAALRAGIEAARGEYVIMADADDSYALDDVAPFVNRLREGNDLVMGNRFRGGITQGAMPALHRYLGNPVLSALGRLLFPSPVGDFHCGMRGFRRDAALRMDLRTNGMEFASEMVVKATIKRMRIAEVPTTLSPDGRSRAPHLRTWRDGWRHLRFLLMYSPRFLFLYPGVVLMVVGTVLGGWLLGGPRTVGNVGFNVNTLMFASAAVLIGAQAVLFWTFAKVFAIAEGLLPEDPFLTWMLSRVFTLEVGVATGATLFIAGLVLAVHVTLAWERHGFGPLDLDRSLRTVIPATTMLILGVEAIMASFFVSILGLRRKS